MELLWPLQCSIWNVQLAYTIIYKELFHKKWYSLVIWKPDQKWLTIQNLDFLAQTLNDRIIDIQTGIRMYTVFTYSSNQDKQ
jgi:hypothetical protein